MGNILPIFPPPTPHGCWYHNNPDSGVKFGQGARYEWLATFAFTNWVDCDCHKRGDCLEGEPPLPPLAEFIYDPNLNLAYKEGIGIPDQSRSNYPANLPSQGGVPNSVADDPRFGNPNSNKFNSRRSIEGSKDKNVTEINAKQNGDDDWIPAPEQKVIPSPWAFPVAVVRAFQALPESRKAAILYRWPHFEPIVTNLTRSFDAEITDLDPKPVMAILLANPGGPTADIVRLMEKRYANMLVQCARQAFVAYLPRVQEEAHEINRKRKAERKRIKAQNKAAGIKDAEIPKVPADDVMKYFKLIAFYEKYWKAGVPHGLYTMGNDHDHFYYSTNLDKPKDVKMHMGRLMCPKFVKHSVNGISEGNTSYVADIDEILSGIHDQIVAHPENRFFRPLKITPNITEVTKGLNLSNLETVFNTSLPGLRVGMSFWSASLWTGVAKY